ncbi:MAG: XisI protein [Candidatus Poribacteria bacterium]|nr:XisI protein [Candidatus Poribacteria bacterium]
MDRRKEYKTIIKQLLLDYAQIKPANGDIETEVIFDEDREQFLLLNIGWDGKRRVHSTTFHIDIIHDKVWLQHNATDIEIAEELVEAGIPREQIVLGFVLPQSRKLTKYGY